MGNPRAGADSRVPHQVAADNHPVVAADNHQVAADNHPVVAADNHPVAVGSRRPVVVGSRRPTAVAAGVAGSHQEAAEVAGSSPEEGAADQSCCLPGSFVCAYSGKQTVVIILSAIVCLFASHSGNR
jgi:hypothetical protein